MRSRCQTRVALATALLFGALAHATSVATAAPRAATCDQVAGATVGLSEHWRLFWPDRFTPTKTSKDRPLLACARSSKPLTRARYLGDNDNPDRIGLVPHLSGDSAELERPHPDGAPSTTGPPTDLRAGAWRRVSSPVRTTPRTTSETIQTNGWSSAALNAKFSKTGRQTSLTLTSEHIPRFNDDGHTFPVAKLVPGSSDEVRVLSTATTAFVLAVARFADQPSELRLRAYRVGESRPVVELPATAALPGAGFAAVTANGSVALAATNEIRIWETGLRSNGFYGYAERTVPATAPTDLEVERLRSADGESRLAFTDATGHRTTPLN